MEKSRTSPSVPLDLAVYMHKKEPFTWAFVVAFNFLQWKTGSSTHSAEEIAAEAGMSETQVRRVARDLCGMKWYKKKRNGLKNSYEKLIPELSYREAFRPQEGEDTGLPDQKKRPDRPEVPSSQDSSTINDLKEQEPAYTGQLTHHPALAVFSKCWQSRYGKKYSFSGQNQRDLKSFLVNKIDPEEYELKAWGYVRSNEPITVKCKHSFNYFMNGFNGWELDFSKGQGSLASDAPTEKEIAL